MQHPNRDWVDNEFGIEPPDEPVQRKSLSIRDRISAIQGELANGALTPDLARESLVRLTALLGNAHDEHRHADHEFKLVLLGCMQGDEAANRARIRAEVTPQFQRAREAKDMADQIVETIRSLKAYMRSLEEELRLAR
jgi:hypothetical protein